MRNVGQSEIIFLHDGHIGHEVSIKKWNWYKTFHTSFLESNSLLYLLDYH